MDVFSHILKLLGYLRKLILHQFADEVFGCIIFHKYDVITENSPKGVRLTLRRLDLRLEIPGLKTPSHQLLDCSFVWGLQLAPHQIPS